MLALHNESIPFHVPHLTPLNEDFTNRDFIIKLAKRCDQFQGLYHWVNLPMGLPMRHYSTLIDYKLTNQIPT